MNKDLIKFTRAESPEKNYNKNCYLIQCYGNGMKSKQWKVEKTWSELDEVDIVLLSYFSNRNYHGREEDLAKWKTEYFNKDIFSGPLSFILPYMYDDNNFDVFDSGWDNIEDIKVFWCDENGERFKEELPKITDIFDNIEELIEYVKEQMKIIRKDIEEDEGVLVQPWEIDEAKEVLKQSGWDEQELRYLRWIGQCRGFGACIEIPQKFADYMCAKFDESDKKDKYVLSVLLNALRTANQKCTDLGWNGPQGLCGTYIYRSSEKILEENGWDEDDSSIVRMPDGRIYTLHEGD